MQKLKIAILLVVFLVVTFIFGITAYASNENIQIVKLSAQKYLFYVKGNLNSSFEFVFSDTNVEPASTEYKEAGTDSESGNYVAYLDEYSTASGFLWVKNSEGYVLEGVEVDLTKALEKTELDNIQKVTKKIKADVSKTNVEEKEIDGNKVTVTTGKVVLEEEGNYEYQIVKLPASEEYTKLMDLAERISKFNSETDLYTKLEIYNEFNALYNKLALELDPEKWEEVENLEILQPEDARTGDKYVLWIRQGADILDAQFLTCKYEEEKVVEKITTKLPVTYDNNILLVILGALVLTTIIVSIRIKSLEKNEK